MKVIIDANILFSAQYKPHSLAGDLIVLAIKEKVHLFAPESVKEEIIRKLRAKLHYNNEEIARTLESLPVRWIEEQIYSLKLPDAKDYITHEADEPLIACALTEQMAIVTGDKHFHPLLKSGILVWKLKDLLDHIAGETS